MTKVIDQQSAIRLSTDLHKKNKTLVITGGCFDIIHIGHIKLLESSKKQGNCLLVLVENDNTVKKLKGNNRPINSLKDRLVVLSTISFIDYVLVLPDMKTNDDYDNLIKKLRPDVIATTRNNPQAIHNKRQAKLVGGKVVYVVNQIKDKSTTRLAKVISDNFK